VNSLFSFSQLAHFSELVHGISNRTMGSVYPPQEGGRQRLAAALGLSESTLFSTKQVHEVDILQVPSPAYGRWSNGRGADGLITATPGVCLMGYFADCVPLLAYDPVHRVAGLAHAGWRGTVQNIAGHLVEGMGRAFGCAPAGMYLGIGPAIGPCCYEVGEEVIARVQALFSTMPADVLRPGRPGHACFDLWSANRRLLEQAGVPPEHIEVAGICTSCNVERYFSFRREGRLNGLFGAVIGVRAEVGGSKIRA
jgi:hypothetical protein